jgi:hypothetical protein
MRRSDRELKDKAGLEAILREADSCRIAFAVGAEPYIVAMNYGYSWVGELPVLYFHSAREGRKLEMMRANNRVCLQLDIGHELVGGASACTWGMRFASLIGYGRLCEIEDAGERRAALDRIMAHYGWQGPGDYSPPALDSVAVLRLDLEKLSGKRKG